MKTEYGIQMYSLRDVTAKDLEGALATVAEMGYKYIEFAGFFGHSAESVKGMLDRNGLICSGTHTNWDELTSDRIVDTIRYHSKIGNKNIIIPGFDRKEETLEKMIEVINYAQPILRENGISLGGMASSGLLPLWMDGSDSPLRRELDSRCAQCSAGPVERDRGLDHECMKLVLEKRIAHGGNVPLRWMMDNVYVRTDPAGNIKMDKEKSTERIDGAVALVMALDRAIRNNGTTDSVYNERGIIVI